MPSRSMSASSTGTAATAGPTPAGAAGLCAGTSVRHAGAATRNATNTIPRAFIVLLDGRHFTRLDRERPLAELGSGKFGGHLLPSYRAGDSSARPVAGG